MVHLTTIPHQDEINDKLVKEVRKVHLDLAPSEEAEFTTSVYGSKFAAADLPKHEMPEREMPKEVAYRMIRDGMELSSPRWIESLTNLSGSVILTRTIRQTSAWTATRC